MKREISRRNFLIVFFTVLCFMTTLLFVRVAYALLFADARESQIQRCFAVDMLEHRVPDWHAPPHSERPPISFGKLCFDRRQLVVEWKFDQSFTRVYAVKDLVLRGPLANSTAKVAPTVLALSTQRNKRNQFYGSTIVDRHLLQAILQHPKRYYVSLEAVYEQGERPTATIREVARHNLNYEI